jgi:hypothetical protein
VLTVAQQQDWKTVLRVGVLPHAAAEGLESLADALRRGDPRIVRQATVEPLYVYREMAVVCCCPLAWLHWRGRPGATVGEVHDAYNAVLAACDAACGSKLAVVSFLEAWDAWDEGELPLPWEDLHAEVDAELARRAALEMVS